MSKFFGLNSALFIIIIAAISAAPLAFAQTTKKSPGESLATIINVADKEISQKTDSLNSLASQINSFGKISSTLKDSLSLSVQNEANSLSDLKAKIDYDTSLPTAVADYKSIVDSYNIYNLLLSQIRMIAASDRALTIVDSMNIVDGKVRSRTASLTGINAAPINQMLSDFNSKIIDISAQSNIVIKTVSGLTPDMGNAVKLAANSAAFKSARENIQTVTEDLAAARKDIGTIIKYLEEMGDAVAPISQK